MELLTGKWFDDRPGSPIGDVAVIHYARAYGFTTNVDERTEWILSKTSAVRVLPMTPDDWHAIWALGDQAVEYLNTLAPVGHTAGWKSEGNSYAFGVWED